MTIFRPCIDLHSGQVKQIVGSSLSDSTEDQLKTNFVSSHSPAYYANLYRELGLSGAHVIKLGPGNEEAATDALQAWPHGLQLGGGINLENAQSWIDKGASKVIVTSFLFPSGKLDIKRLEELSIAIGKDRLVVDLRLVFVLLKDRALMSIQRGSCKRVGNEWIVAMNKWQTLTDTKLSKETFDLLSTYCSEFLVHAADVEGLCKGIDEDLVKALGEWVSLPCTYAGGGKELSDLDLVQSLSGGKVDLTFGSALDLFGGTGVEFLDAVTWNRNSQT